MTHDVISIFKQVPRFCKIIKKKEKKKKNFSPHAMTHLDRFPIGASCRVCFCYYLVFLCVWMNFVDELFQGKNIILLLSTFMYSNRQLENYRHTHLFTNCCSVFTARYYNTYYTMVLINFSFIHKKRN